MRLFPSRTLVPALPGISGVARPARAGRDDAMAATRAVARRAEPGDIIVLDQIDLDRVSAEAVVAARPAVVVNVRASISGRHPARGASVVVAAGIPLVDDVGPGLLSELREGQRIRVDDASVYAGERLLGTGDLLTIEAVSDSEGRARIGMSGRLDTVGADAAAFLRTHEALLLEGEGLPDTGLPIKGRKVLVVGPGERSATEVRTLRRWVREFRPLVVGADGGALLAHRAGLRLDLVVGEPGDLPGRALARARRVLTEQIPGGFAAGDYAVILAADAGAALIVLAGAPASYDELLDRDRESAAALLAIRLRAGDLLVDAPAVAALQRPAIGFLGAVSVAVAGVIALAAALASVPGGHELAQRLRDVLPW